MLLRALAVWGILLLLAVANGGFRETALVPRLGTGGAHVVSTLLLSTLILLTTKLLAPWLGVPDDGTALLVGAGWVALTLAFELLAGHYLFHKEWSLLLADYDLRHGRIWPLVLVATFVAPWLWRQ